MIAGKRQSSRYPQLPTFGGFDEGQVVLFRRFNRRRSQSYSWRPPRMERREVMPIAEHSGRRHGRDKPGHGESLLVAVGVIWNGERR
jgi:hypothetical protein